MQYTEEQIKKALESLSDEEKELIEKRYGPDLHGPDLHDVRLDELLKLKKATFRSEELDESLLEGLSDEQKELIKRKFGQISKSDETATDMKPVKK